MQFNLSNAVENSHSEYYSFQRPSQSRQQGLDCAYPRCDRVFSSAKELQKHLNKPDPYHDLNGLQKHKRNDYNETFEVRVIAHMRAAHCGDVPETDTDNFPDTIRQSHVFNNESAEKWRGFRDL